MQLLQSCTKSSICPWIADQTGSQCLPSAISLFVRTFVPADIKENIKTLCYWTSVEGNHRWRFHGPLARYVKLWVVHVPGMPGTFSPAIAGWRSRHASRHARAVMHVGIANNLWFPLKSVAGKTFSAFPAHAQPTLLRIWQEAHVMTSPWDGMVHSPVLFWPTTEIVINETFNIVTHGDGTAFSKFTDL